MTKDSLIKEVVVPDIGDFDSVEVIEVLVQAGDTVAVEDSLISVESDKATMEIPAPEAGVVMEVKVAVGDSVSQGSLLLILEPSGDAPVEAASVTPSVTETAAPAPVASKPAPVAQPAQAIQHKPSPTAIINELSFARAYASPSVRKFARELGVEDSLVEFEGLTPQMIEALAKDGVLTLEDFATCADWELAGGWTTVDGERIKDDGLLESFDVSLETAQNMVMTARILLGWVDPADLEAEEEDGEGDDEDRADAEGTTAPEAGA